MHTLSTGFRTSLHFKLSFTGGPLRLFMALLLTPIFQPSHFYKTQHIFDSLIESGTNDLKTYFDRTKRACQSPYLLSTSSFGHLISAPVQCTLYSTQFALTSLPQFASFFFWKMHLLNRNFFATAFHLFYIVILLPSSLQISACVYSLAFVCARSRRSQRTLYHWRPTRCSHVCWSRKIWLCAHYRFQQSGCFLHTRSCVWASFCVWNTSYALPFLYCGHCVGSRTPSRFSSPYSVPHTSASKPITHSRFS